MYWVITAYISEMNGSNVIRDWRKELRIPVLLCHKVLVLYMKWNSAS